MQLHATFLAAVAADPDDSNVLRGTAVPHGQVGYTSAGRAVIHAGALPVDDRPTVVLFHDITRPAGVVTGLEDDDDRLAFTARLSDVPDGRNAAVLAKDGALTGVSVGIQVVDHYVEDGVIHVTAATWDELSLVTRPAFEAARLAASAHTPKESAVVDLTPAPVEAVDPAPTVTATHTPPTFTAPRTFHDVGAALQAAARQGGVQAIKAALADITTTLGVPAPSYADALVERIATGMPTVDAFGPVSVPSGRRVYRRHWKVEPVPGKQATQKTQIATNAASLEWKPVDFDTYAWGADFAVQLLDQEGDGIIAEFLDTAGDIIGEQIEDAFVASLIAAATAGPTGGFTVANLGTAMGQLASAGFSPDLVVVSGDVYGDAFTQLGKDGPGLYGLVNSNFPVPRIVVSPGAPADTCVVADRRAARVWLSGKPTLRAVEVGLLGINAGVYQYAASAVDHAAGLVKITPTP
jgi:HK97 family phage prohead protease